MPYALHRVAKTDWNDEVTHALSTIHNDGDWEAILPFYGEDDLREFYDALHAYFTDGKISNEVVESEEISGNWKQMWWAIKTAREYGAPASRTDDQIGNTIREAARRGRIKGAHQSINGAEWWLPVRALENYLAGVSWREAKSMPPTKYPIIYGLNDLPVGNSGKTARDFLEDGQNLSHEQNGVVYSLYLDSNGNVCGVVDEEHYRYLGQSVPVVATGRAIAIPDDRKQQNAILKQYGYRWEKFTQDDLDDNDDFNRQPGWYLFHGTGAATREIGSVETAFDEINRGVSVVERERHHQRLAEQEQRQRAHQRELQFRGLEKAIKDRNQRANSASGEMVIDHRILHLGAGYTGWSLHRDGDVAYLCDVTWEDPQYWRIDWNEIESMVTNLSEQ